MTNYIKNFINNGQKRFVENIATKQKKSLYLGVRVYSNLGGKFIKGNMKNLINILAHNKNHFSNSYSTKRIGKRALL